MIRTWTDDESEEIVADILAVDWSGGSWAGMTAANVPEADPNLKTEPKKKRRGVGRKFFDEK